MSKVELVEFFQHILDYAEDFDWETLHCAPGRLSRLTGFFSLVLYWQFLTLLMCSLVFYKARPQTCSLVWTELRIFASVERERAKFSGICDKAVEVVGQPSAFRGKPNTYAYNRELHVTVINNVHKQLRNKFEG